MTAQEERDDDLRAVLLTPVGRRFIWRFLEQAGLYAQSFAVETHATAYNEGRRSLATALMRECQRVAPESWVRLVREQLDDMERQAHAVVPEDDDVAGD